MGSVNPKRALRFKRKKRIRKKIQGTLVRPRLSVFRSAKHIYAQIIDDNAGKTFVAASTNEKTVKDDPELSTKDKTAQAAHIGKLAGERALAKGITEVVFDRGGYLYHGRVKALSEGARKAGLKF